MGLPFCNSFECIGFPRPSVCSSLVGEVGSWPGAGHGGRTLKSSFMVTCYISKASFPLFSQEPTLCCTGERSQGFPFATLPLSYVSWHIFAFYVKMRSHSVSQTGFEFTLVQATLNVDLPILASWVARISYLHCQVQPHLPFLSLTQSLYLFKTDVLLFIPEWTFTDTSFAL